MLKFTSALLGVLLFTVAAAEERDWPDVELSCESVSEEGENDADEREFVFYIKPTSNELIVSEFVSAEASIRRLETQDLKITDTSYWYTDTSSQFDIDRTTLEFSISFSYSLGSSYSGTGSCFVINPQI